MTALRAPTIIAGQTSAYGKRQMSLSEVREYATYYLLLPWDLATTSLERKGGERRSDVTKPDVADGDLDLHVFIAARGLGAHLFMDSMVDNSLVMAHFFADRASSAALLSSSRFLSF
jgi:hypothetical protein